MGFLSRIFGGGREPREPPRARPPGGDDRLIGYAGPPVATLSREGLLGQLRRLGYEGDLAERTLQGALAVTSIMSPQQLREIIGGTLPLTASNLTLKWAAHRRAASR